MVSAKFPGSTNDSLAWQSCNFYLQYIMEKKLPKEFFIIGDEAFPCTEYLLTPYSGRHLGIWKDSFNFHLSAMRQTIERAFGILTRRWGIFWRPLSMAMSRWSLVITVCAKLHNLCIEQGLVEIPLAVEDLQDADNILPIMNESTESFT